MKKILSLAKNKLSNVSAFTIIELLVVIGIISILAVSLLITLNPAEAQRRARDSARLKDANTLQAAVEQYLNDGSAAFCTTICLSNSVSGSTGPGSQTCASTNWLGVSMCNYAKSIPVDPVNNSTRGCYGSGGAVSGCLMIYRFKMSGSDYEIAVRQESSSNQAKVTSSLNGSTAINWVSIRTSTTPIITETPL